MSFKNGETVIYSGKEYIIVGRAACMTREALYVIKIKDGSDNQEITVPEKELTKPSSNIKIQNFSSPEKKVKIDPDTVGSAVKYNKNNMMEKLSTLATSTQDRLDGEQPPTLLSKAEYDTFKREYDSFNQNSSQLKKIADPGKCFTNYVVKNGLLKDALRSKNITYKWREKEEMYGISGELSIFGLLNFALMTTNIIVDVDNKASSSNKANKIIKRDNKGGVVNDFINYYKDTYLTAEFSNRESLDDTRVKDVTTHMLKVLEEIKTNYYKYNKTRDEVSAIFCAESYKLIVQIILTKSSLDVSQACGLTELVNENKFCVFSTYDASAALNTPIGPVMTASVFEGASVSINPTAYIIDDKCVISILYLYKYEKERQKVIGSSSFLDIVFTMLTQLDTESRNNSVDMYEPNVGYNSDLSTAFIQHMDSLTSETNENVPKTVYKKLYDLEIPNSIFVRCNKYVYEFISKLVLNYNVSKGKLEPESITSESRDIRAHDYANSPIRYFGVYIYIIKRICDWLLNNKGTTNLDINSIEIDQQVIDNINNLSEEEIDLLTKFIIEKESSELKSVVNSKQEVTTTSSRKSRRTTSGRSATSSFNIEEDENYKNFLNDIHYIPSIFTTNEKKYDFLKIIYQLMCIQNSDKFEDEQNINLVNKTIVHSVKDTGFKNPNPRVILTCGPLFKKNRNNTPMVQQLINEGITHNSGYTLDDGTFGIVDLSLKYYGINNSPNTLLLYSVYGEVDAANARITCYTNEVNSHINGQLYYNGICCAEVYSGYYKEKYPNQTKEICKNIETKIIPINYMLFDAYLNRKYKITSQTAPLVLKNLIEYIRNTTTTTEFGEIKEKLDSFLTSLERINIREKKRVAELYDSALKPIVTSFVVNLSTLYDLCIKNENPEKCRKMLEEIERIVNTLDSILSGGTTESSKKGGGGNQSSCFGSSCISTEEVEEEKKEEFEPYSGPVFGQYITVENGIFVTKLIKSEEELKRLEEYYGYTKEEEEIPYVDSFDTDEKVDEITGSNEEELGSSTDNSDKQVSFYDEEINDYNNNVNKTPSNSSSRTSSPRTIPQMGSRDGLNSLLKAGGKKTKKHKKHKKPKNKKTTKKNVKRQTKHNKTTKRKKPTKRPAKRTRRQRHHSKY